MDGRVQLGTWSIFLSSNNHLHDDADGPIRYGYMHLFGGGGQPNACMQRPKRVRQGDHYDGVYREYRLRGWPPKRPPSSAAKATSAQEG